MTKTEQSTALADQTPFDDENETGEEEDISPLVAEVLEAISEKGLSLDELQEATIWIISFVRCEVDDLTDPSDRAAICEAARIGERLQVASEIIESLDLSVDLFNDDGEDDLEGAAA